jgi:23S rRNA (uracil1939-C5)-methyltransferase
MQQASAEIEKFSHDGRGIARIDGKTTFIQGALPGETVVFQYIKRKSAFDEGITLSVENPSPNRVEPRCPHFGVCGGCSLQHLSPVVQIQEKQSLFLDILSRIGHCQPESILPPLVGPIWHYRHKARLSVKYNKKAQSVWLGFRKKNLGRQVMDIGPCPILHQQVDEQINHLRELITTLDSPENIAQVEVAAGDETIALIFRNLAALSPTDEEKLTAFAQQTGFRIFLQPKGPDTVYQLYPTESNEYLQYQLPSEQITFSFYPTDFTQINTGLNRLMVPLALELLALDPRDAVLDLFCGLGNFSLPIAKHCNKVIGIEGSDAMVARAQMNATLNHLSNVEFIAANLDDERIGDLLAIYPVNKLLLDPARTGALEVVKQIERIAPQRIVYVSCNPATLARDAGILVNEKGYRMTKAGVMDMFPHTDHVESIALFEK